MRIGVDLGGTKIEAAALAADGRVALRRRVPTPRADYAATVAATAGLVAALETEIGVRATVGVGTPGSVSPRTGRMRNANSTWLNDRPLQADLEAALERPVRIANDADCFALSEATDGAARGARVAFGVILGTGVGGGLALAGRPWPGADGIAGEWGHVALPWPRTDEVPGPACWCGRSGCVETWLSGPALARDHRSRTGVTLAAAEIAARTAAGDAPARATLSAWEERLGRALAVVVDVVDPDVVVLGGGLSNVAGLAQRLPERIAPHVFSDGLALSVVKNAHGDSSGVRGAAWLWPPEGEAGPRGAGG